MLLGFYSYLSRFRVLEEKYSSSFSTIPTSTYTSLPIPLPILLLPISLLSILSLVLLSKFLDRTLPLPLLSKLKEVLK